MGNSRKIYNINICNKLCFSLSLFFIRIFVAEITLCWDFDKTTA